MFVEVVLPNLMLESALGAEGLENDPDCSRSSRERSCKSAP